jgi:hypothetical protein
MQRLMPSSDGGDDFIGVGYPPEGFGVGVVIAEEAVHGRLKVDDRSEDGAWSEWRRSLRRR